MGLRGVGVPEKRFGGYLRRLRERRKLTLEAAEDLSTTLRTRVTSSYLSRLESGLTVPNLTRLSVIGRIYDVPLTTLVEKFEIEQRRHGRREHDLPRAFDELEALLRRKLRSGAYIEVLEIVGAAELRLEEDAALAADHGVHGARYLRLVECQAMVHLELYESAKHESERILELDDLRLDHRLAAWQFFVACCMKLERFQLALATLDRAEREARDPAALPRMRADFSMLRGNIFVLTGQYREAVAAYAATLRLYRALDQRLEVCRTRMHIGGALTEMGKLNSAGRCLARAMEEAESSGFEQLCALGQAHLAALAYRNGDHARAEAHGQRAVGLARRLGLQAVAFKSNYYLMLAARAGGDARAAAAYRRLLLAQLDQPMPPSAERERFRASLAEPEDGGSS